jgi:hypothetical protein
MRTLTKKNLSIRGVALVFAVLAFASCLNPIGFISENQNNRSGDPVSDGPQAPGETSPGSGGSTVGEEEGDSPGALTDNNRDRLGLLILKNLSPDIDVEYAHLVLSSSAYSMDPGPVRQDQKSILLRSGEWGVTAHYTNNQGAAVDTIPKNVNIIHGQVSYMYFYKNRQGSYSLSTAWPPEAGDQADENTDPGLIIGDDEGWLKVFNRSPTATIERVAYNNNGTWIDIDIPNPTHTIVPSDESDPNLVVPKGSWAFRFKVATKSTYSVAVSRTISAGKVTAIEYSDALDSDLPPPGYGTLRLVNNTTGMIIKVLTKSVTINSEETLWNNATGTDNEKETQLGFRMDANGFTTRTFNITLGQKGSGNSTAVQVLYAGGQVGSERSYIVQCYTNNASFYESSVLIQDARITTLTIEPDTTQVVVTDPGNSGPGTTGDLRIYNAYGGVLPFKVFKIILYERVLENAPTIEEKYDNGYRTLQRPSPSADPIPADYPVTPVIAGKGGHYGASPAVNADGNSYVFPDGFPHAKFYLLGWNVFADNSLGYPVKRSNDNYLEKGEYADLLHLDEGYYKLLIVGGSYPWEFYTGDDGGVDSDSSGGTDQPGSPPSNTVGGVKIDEARITYDLGDIFITRHTTKAINFNPHIPGVNDNDMPTGYVTVDFMHAGTVSGTSGNIVRTQFVSRRWVGPAVVKSGIQKQGSKISVDKAVNRRHLVLAYDRVIHPGDDAATFYLPADMYGMRVWDSPLNSWSGRSSDRYLDLDLRQMAGKRILVTWLYPRLTLMSDMEETTYYPVSDLNLAYWIPAPKEKVMPVHKIDSGYQYSGQISWYVSNAKLNTDNNGDHNQEFGQYSSSKSFLSTTNWTGAGTNSIDTSYFVELEKYVIANAGRIETGLNLSPGTIIAANWRQYYQFEAGLIYVARVELDPIPPFSFQFNVAGNISPSGDQVKWTYDNATVDPPELSAATVWYEQINVFNSSYNNNPGGVTPNNAKGRLKFTIDEAKGGTVWICFPKSPSSP